MHRETKRRSSEAVTVLLCALLAGALVLGCGKKQGSGEKSAGQSARTTEETEAPAETTTAPAETTSSSASGAAGEAAQVTIDLVAHDIAFDKKTITVPAGARVTIHFDNQDAGIPHDFSLYKTPAAKDELFDGETITGPKVIDYTFTAPTTPGDYFFRCDVHPDRMKGTFVVK